MAEVIKMPLMSDTMEEGVVSKWHVKVGDTVKPGDLLADIETDKATNEFESFWSGTLSTPTSGGSATCSLQSHAEKSRNLTCPRPRLTALSKPNPYSTGGMGREGSK